MPAKTIIPGAIGPDPEALVFMKSTADRLFGRDCLISVPGAGRHRFPLITMGAVMGGNLRVGHGIATPAKARAMLGTKGADAVNF